MPMTTEVLTCRRCKRIVTISADSEALRRWHAGTHIQEALSTLSPGEREMLISGYCEPCFDEITESI